MTTRDRVDARQSRSPAPFVVDVPEAVLDYLRRRLEQTRWIDQLPGTSWELGVDVGYLQELCSYWARTFDWRAAEARLNAHPQHTTDIDGLHIHFIHARSPEPDALPLIL